MPVVRRRAGGAPLVPLVLLARADRSRTARDGAARDGAARGCAACGCAACRGATRSRAEARFAGCGARRLARSAAVSDAAVTDACRPPDGPLVC